LRIDAYKACYSFRGVVTWRISGHSIYTQMSLHEMKLIITWLKMIAKKMASLLSETQAWEMSSHKGQLIFE